MLVKAHKYHQIYITMMRPAKLLTSKPLVRYAITMHTAAIIAYKFLAALTHYIYTMRANSFKPNLPKD